MKSEQCAYPKCRNAPQHQCAICELHFCEEHCVNRGGWICWEDWRMRTSSKSALNLPFFLRSPLYVAQGRSPNTQALFIILYAIVAGIIAVLVIGKL